MTTYYVGVGGNDGNAGTSWALRRLTVGAGEGLLGAGDTLYIGPGVYREQIMFGASGGSLYAAGTVSVTNGSTTVTGAGTAFIANVTAIVGYFHIPVLVSGNDGVANGTATFTSVAGNFQASMIGKIIQINTRAAYRVGAVAAANSITLVDVNALGWPAAGVNLVYSVMSGESPYEIDSVTDDTHFELERAWCGPTLTGMTYETWQAIIWIGDVSGENTDGVGGVVRITASLNDQTAPGGSVIVGTSWRDYRVLRGLRLDLSVRGIDVTSTNHMIIEDCAFLDITSYAIESFSALKYLYIRRCLFLNAQVAVYFYSAAPASDIGYIVENCLIICGVAGIVITRLGGAIIKNNTFSGIQDDVIASWVAPPVGQTLVVENNIMTVYQDGIVSGAVGCITENYNSLWMGVLFDRKNTTAGAQSVAYPALFESPLLLRGFEYVWWAGKFSEWSQLRALAGAFERNHDLRGIGRPLTAAKNSWGSLQFTDAERETGTVHRGSVSMVLADVGRVQFRVPATNHSTTISVWVYREVNYAGVNPQMVIKQPGQTDRVTLDAGAAGAWNRLVDSFTPATLPPYIIVELVSNNTAAAGNYDVFFDTLNVFSGRANDTGDFEEWVWNRQLFSQYGKITSPVKLEVTGGDVFREVNAQGDLVRLT